MDIINERMDYIVNEVVLMNTINNSIIEKEEEDYIDYMNDIINEEELDNERYDYYKNQFLMNYGCECKYCNRLYGVDNNSEEYDCCLDCFTNNMEIE